MKREYWDFNVLETDHNSGVKSKISFPFESMLQYDHPNSTHYIVKQSGNPAGSSEMPCQDMNWQVRYFD